MIRDACQGTAPRQREIFHAVAAPAEAGANDTGSSIGNGSCGICARPIRSCAAGAHGDQGHGCSVTASDLVGRPRRARRGIEGQRPRRLEVVWSGPADRTHAYQTRRYSPGGKLCSAFAKEIVDAQEMQFCTPPTNSS